MLGEDGIAKTHFKEGDWMQVDTTNVRIRQNGVTDSGINGTSKTY